MKGFGNNDRTNKKSTEKKVKDFQKDQPISYGLASIVLALGLGVGAAMVRHFFSRIKKKAEQA